MSEKSAQWRPGQTVCRCCLAEGCYKDISTEYFWMGKREVYADMLIETFDVSIGFSQSSGPSSSSRLICEPCISRLRDASEFKRQVQECERTFMTHLEPGSSNVTEIEVPLDDKDVKLEQVKQEKDASEDEFFDRDDFFEDDDDMDDEPLTKLATKIPKKESVDLLDLLDSAKVAEKRKATAKAKAPPAKKAKAKEAKPSPSKPKPVEKKKKDICPRKSRLDAESILQFATAYPFRIPDSSMQCVYCDDVTFEEPLEFRQHMDKEHTEFNVKHAFFHIRNHDIYLKVDCTSLKCRLCGNLGDDLLSIAKHLNEVHNQRINLDEPLKLEIFDFNEKWKCAVCGTKAITLRALSRHTTSHYRKHTCESCGRSYQNSNALKNHVSTSHADGKKCIKCKTVYTNRLEHLLASKDCRPYVCGICSERFVSNYQRDIHKEDVHGAEKKRFPCPNCDRVFHEKTQCREHFFIVHTDRFPCLFCGKRFREKSRLNSHLVIHTGVKAFECSVCTKAFATKKCLVQHMWAHREVKRFNCDSCKKQFNQKVTWKAHMKSYHPDQAPSDVFPDL